MPSCERCACWAVLGRGLEESETSGSAVGRGSWPGTTHSVLKFLALLDWTGRLVLAV